MWVRGLAVLVLSLAAPNAYATSFAVLFGDQNVDGCDSVDIDDVVFDSQEATTAAAWPWDLDILQENRKAGYRVYHPGKPQYGNITIRAGKGTGGSKELYTWWQDSRRNADSSQTITIIAFNAKGGKTRQYNLLECYPVKWSAGDTDPTSGGVAVDTLVCRIGGLELIALSEDEPKNPKVEVAIRGDDSGSDPDSAWETCSFNVWTGGEPTLIQKWPFRETAHYRELPGEKAVTDLVLRGPLTSGRKNLCEWITDSVNGKPWRKTVTVKEITKDGGAGKTFIYHDCFPIRYVFPSFSEGDSANARTEWITCKMGRVELR
jgi:phage tail-like protein